MSEVDLKKLATDTAGKTLDSGASFHRHYLEILTALRTATSGMAAEVERLKYWQGEMNKEVVRVLHGTNCKDLDGLATQLTAANAEIERLTERNKELEAALKEADFYLINVIGAAEPSYWIHKAEDALAKALTPSTETKEGE